MNEMEREVERLMACLPAYLCERTGLQMSQVEALLDAQEAFWDDQPHVLGQLFILGIPLEDDPEHA